MKYLIEFSIKYKQLVAIFSIAVAIWGGYSLFHIPLDAVPDITNTQVQIVTRAPEYAAEEVELFITIPIEKVMANLKKVETVRSISAGGLSVVNVVFDDDMPLLEARQLANEQLSSVAGDIPNGIDSPELMPITTGLGEIYQYILQIDTTLGPKLSDTELRTLHDWVIRPALAGIPGVVEISSFGGKVKQYEVALDPIRMNTLNITMDEVADALRKGNANAGGSYIEFNRQAAYIRVEGMVKTVEDIKQICIGVREKMPVLISDVATVKTGYMQRLGAMTSNGKGEATGGVVMMLKDARSFEVVKSVKERLAQIAPSLPKQVKIVPFLDRARLISMTTSTVAENLILGALIVIFALTLILGNWRAGLITASVIPLAFLFAIGCMDMMGLSINLISLGAIDFGVIVDGAVIVVEGSLFFMRKSVHGTFDQAQRDHVVLKAGTEVAQAAGFGQIIIFLVYLPLLALSGVEGKMFKPMAYTVALALIGATIFSFSYVPMVASLLLKSKVSKFEHFSEKIIGGLRDVYIRGLQSIIRFRFWVLAIALGLIVLTYPVAQQLGGEFIPTLDEGDLAMQMSLPPGSGLQEAIKAATTAEQIILKNFPEVIQAVAKIGSAEVPTDPMPPEEADFVLSMKPRHEWVSAKSREEMFEKLKLALKAVPGASFEFTQPIELRFNELLTGAKSDIVISVYGTSLETLSETGDNIVELLHNVKGVGDIRAEPIEGMPQIKITPNRLRLAQLGLSVDDINQTIRTAFAGAYAGVVAENDQVFDLVARLPFNLRNDPNMVGDLKIRTPMGNYVLLSQIADIKLISAPNRINRHNIRRRVNVGINVRGRDIGSLANEIQETLNRKLDLPIGYNIEYGGEFENFQRAISRLKLVTPVVLVIIFGLLYLSFRSIKQALLIYTAIPFAIVGGIISLYLRDMPFSISAAIGFIAVSGLAALNGIVLVGYFNQLKSQGRKQLFGRIIRGCSIRFRPVITTALVAALGFLPMAVSDAAGAEVQRPLATVVIGGLLTSTLLTLFLLPILYSLIEKRNK